jgi:phage host-nuclease inhibitor protein Gam
MSLDIEEIIEKDEAPETVFFEFDRLKCDLALKALIEVDKEVESVNELADKEIQMIEDYRKRELERLDKKISWIARGMENYIRNSGDKTIRFVHGTIRLRQGRDKVEIENVELFLPEARERGLLRNIPAKEEPDLVATLAHFKKTGEIVPGMKFIPATTNFSYTLNKGGNNGNGEEELPTKG